MKNFLKFLIVLLCSSIVLISCGSDDSSDTTNGTSSTENADKVIADNFNSTLDKFKLPDNLANSSDGNALALSSLVTGQKTLLTAFSGFFQVPDNAISASAKGSTNLRRFTWDNGQGTSVIYTLDETSEGFNVKYVWTIDGETSTLFDGFLSKDGNKGNLTFNPDKVAEKIVYNWEVIGNTLSYNITTASGEIKMLINENGSGSLDLFDDGIKVSEYKWNADGSGSIKNIETGETLNWSAS